MAAWAWVRRWGYGMYCWSMFGVVLLAFGLPMAIWPGPKRQRRRIARLATRLMFRLAGMPLQVRGLERLPSGPHVLVANHTSFLDGLVLSASLPPSPGYAFVVRWQYRRQILLWPLLRALGTVVMRPREPGKASESNIDALLAALRGGDNLVIFPEGSIRRAPGVRPFHSGAFVAAAQARVPIVVAGIQGARKALPLKSWHPVRTRIALTVGAVLEPGTADTAATMIYARAARARMIPLAGENAAEDKDRWSGLQRP